MSSSAYKITVVAVVAIIIAVGVIARASKRSSESRPPEPPTVTTSEVGSVAAVPARADEVSGPGESETGVGSATETGQLPAVIDLGMGKCIPCKQMKPILDELAKEYEGRARIEIIDIGDHPDQADEYEVRLIPTQVFINAQGEEVFRHEGFMPKQDIVAQLQAMGVE